MSVVWRFVRRVTAAERLAGLGHGYGLVADESRLAARLRVQRRAAKDAY
jgi:hypothetical protein